jgi:hypothetical protein
MIHPILETKETSIKRDYSIVFKDNDITELKRMLLSLNKPGFVAIGPNNL